MRSPRASAAAVAALCAIVGTIGVGPMDATQDAGVDALQNVRRAIAGDARITSLRIEGLKPRLSSAGSRSSAPPSGIEMIFLAPHHFRHTNRSSSMVSYGGFSNSTPLSGGRALDPNATFDPGTPDAHFVQSQRTQVARWLLGMVGDPLGVLDLRARAEGQAVHITGADGFDAVLESDAATGLPVRLRYRDGIGFPEPGDVGTGAGMLEPADVTMSFEDRRLVNGVRIPHRIVRRARSLASGRERTIDELVFDRIEINPALHASDFQKNP
jgi:hypothetical protein